ncbi:MAG: DUF4404 family protein [Herminiimonas sp.]|nr:DUF4404 family protein [Herminiimonas sp.]
MSTDNLKQTLAELHAALEKSGPLDPELVQLLRTLDDDIQIKLVQHAEATQAPATEVTPDDDGLSSRAQALSAKFAAQHPHLEPVLREFTETLQRIGI